MKPYFKFASAAKKQDTKQSSLANRNRPVNQMNQSETQTEYLRQALSAGKRMGISHS